jgi:riboflavin synthase
MFTGIIEELGHIALLEQRGEGARIRVQCRKVLEDCGTGASIAVNGVCLTALDIEPHSFAADLAPETMARTNLGDLALGAAVNLERPMQLNARLSGHIVQGHVDGTGHIAQLRELGQGNWWLAVDVPEQLARYCITKGSICLDGISLTIAALEGLRVAVTIIPHTYESTNLHSRRVGDRVNVEADVIAKYVERLTSAR